MRSEAKVFINDVELSNAQAMALRVAVTQLFADMSADPYSLGEDEHGVAMTKDYKDRCGEILAVMIKVLDSSAS
ncbi:hypothetical protein [Rhizobium lusitanum]|uniref:Uncharacterized protein n=1 Tax=Rhizobium lusitanum TaxID=293958 RepID=A0A1C3VRE4_9HYPH|nr:hypothetical protein [Rhizobium lusitanum]SCB30145.1 hypothetical protein GA0061101_10667 [Rhizobium lusitanum]